MSLWTEMMRLWLVARALAVALAISVAHAETCPPGTIVRVVREWPMTLSTNTVLHMPVLHCPVVGECWMAPEPEEIEAPVTILCLTPKEEADAEARTP